MINWSKFKDLDSIESACLSDTVYPLSSTIVSQISPIDHTGILLNNDMLLNADDRRYVLSQSSPCRRAYDFRSNKVKAMEGAIRDLSSYIARRDAAMATSPSPDYDQGIGQDVAGMSTTLVDQDQMSDCTLSPSVPSAKPLSHPLAALPSSESTVLYASRAYASSSTASPTSASSTFTSQKTSTAPTSFSHGLSIADLIHPPLVIPVPSTRSSSPMMPDPDMGHDISNHYSPDQGILRATLDDVRASNVHGNSQGSMHAMLSRATATSAGRVKRRCLKAPRMRRASRRRKPEDSIDTPSAGPSAWLAHPERQVSNVNQPSNSGQKSQVSQTFSHSRNYKRHSSMPATAYADSAILSDANSSLLDHWWYTEQLRHTTDESTQPDLSPSPPGLRSRPGQIEQQPDRPGLDFARPKPYNIAHNQLAQPQDMIEAEDDEEDEDGACQDDSHMPKHGIYAYTHDNDGLYSSLSRQKRYGYIAGDVPGVRESKVRTRGRVRERVRRPSKDMTNRPEEKADRSIVSGIKRQREDSPGTAAADDRGRTSRQISMAQEGLRGRTSSPPSKQRPIDMTDEPLNEDDLRDIREAQRLSEKWWKHTA